MAVGVLGDFTMRKLYQIEMENPLRSDLSHDEVLARSRRPSLTE